jgi:hypothetical protein
MTMPAVSVQFDFSNSPIFGYTFTIGDPQHGILGSDVLGDVASDIVDISDQVGKISIRRGYNLLQDQFQAGTATIKVYDATGKWNPQNTSSVYYGKLLPLRKIRVTANNKFLFSGYTVAYNYTYPKDQDIGFVSIECVDAFRLFNMANVTTVTGAVAGETSGTRVGRILDTVSWPTSMRTIATGNTTVAADPGTTRTSLGAIKSIEFAEQGAFYVSPTGNAIFKNRTAIIQTNGANPTSFANDGTGIGYKNIVFNFDDKLIINQANVTRSSGGTLQNAFNTASINTYFPHSINFTDVLVQTDTAALDIARVYVATRADTTIRIDALTLDLNTPDYDAGVTAAITLDFFDTVAIKNVGQDGTVIQKTLQCMGFNHEITPNSFNTTITTSESIVDGFIVGSSLFGIIGTSVMTY